MRCLRPVHDVHPGTVRLRQMRRETAGRSSLRPAGAELADHDLHGTYSTTVPRNISTQKPATLARTPMDLVDVPDPGFLLPDWVITKPRLTGVCGSDAKQVFMDFGEMNMDNPMRDFSSMPQVLGHEVVADVVALGPEAEGLDVGDRVVLNPWLSCVPRGVSPGGRAGRSSSIPH